jgi:hypothetical protein
MCGNLHPAESEWQELTRYFECGDLLKKPRMHGWVLLNVHNAEGEARAPFGDKCAHDRLCALTEFAPWATVERDEGLLHAGILPRRVQIPYEGPL